MAKYTIFQQDKQFKKVGTGRNAKSRAYWRTISYNHGEFNSLDLAKDECDAYNNNTEMKVYRKVVYSHAKQSVIYPS